MKRCIIASLGALCAIPAALAGFSQMGQRLPADTNALVAINFGPLMQTPLAQKEDWPTRWTSLYEAGPVTIPPGTERVLFGARVLHDLESSKWQISLMETQQQISMQEIARAVGGTTEKMWDKQAVLSPSRVYFVALSPELMATITGGDRQFAVAWVREAKPSGPDSSFIKQVVSGLGASSHIILAIDLQDQFSAAEIRKAMDIDPFKATGKATADTETLSELLSTIQNIFVQITVGDTPKAQVDIAFGMNVGSLEFYGKPLMLEILNRNGLATPEIKDWTIQVNGPRVTLQGELTATSLRNVLGLISGPLPPYAEARSAQPSDAPAAAAKASQAYYRSISAIIDNYAGQKDYSEAAGWLRQEAQRIDRLSVLNVDPELAAWGAAVGAKMREAAAMLKGDQMGAAAGRQGVAIGGAYGGYGGYNGSVAYYDGYYDNGHYRSNANAVANQNARREQSRITSEKKTESIRKVSELMSGLVAERSKLKLTLTEKYQVPF